METATGADKPKRKRTKKRYQVNVQVLHVYKVFIDAWSPQDAEARAGRMQTQDIADCNNGVQAKLDDVEVQHIECMECCGNVELSEWAGLNSYDKGAWPGSSPDGN